MTQPYNKAIPIAPKPARNQPQDDYQAKADRADGNHRSPRIGESVYDRSGLTPGFQRSPEPGAFKDHLARMHEFHGSEIGKAFDGGTIFGSEPAHNTELSEDKVQARRAARDAAARKTILADLKADQPGLFDTAGSGANAKAEAGKASAGYTDATPHSNAPRK